MLLLRPSPHAIRPQIESNSRPIHSAASETSSSDSGLPAPTGTRPAEDILRRQTGGLAAANNNNNDNDSLPQATGVGRNLNASLEAQAKLRDTVQQLHFNKSLSFAVDRMPSRDQQVEQAESGGAGELQVAELSSNLLPSQGHQQLASLVPLLEQRNQQLVSVSPTRVPEQVVEWAPGDAPSPLGPGDPLETAADETHQQQSADKQSADWGRRKSAQGNRLQAAAERPPPVGYEDIMTWTPAAGPAAYRAGSAGFQPARGQSQVGPTDSMAEQSNRRPSHFRQRQEEEGSSSPATSEPRAEDNQIELPTSVQYSTGGASSGPGPEPDGRNEQFFAPALKYAAPRGDSNETTSDAKRAPTRGRKLARGRAQRPAGSGTKPTNGSSEHYIGSEGADSQQSAKYLNLAASSRPKSSAGDEEDTERASKADEERPAPNSNDDGDDYEAPDGTSHETPPDEEDRELRKRPEKASFKSSSKVQAYSTWEQIRDPAQRRPKQRKGSKKVAKGSGLKSTPQRLQQTEGWPPEAKPSEEVDNRQEIQWSPADTSGPQTAGDPNQQVGQAKSSQAGGRLAVIKTFRVAGPQELGGGKQVEQQVDADLANVTANYVFKEARQTRQVAQLQPSSRWPAPVLGGFSPRPSSLGPVLQRVPISKLQAASNQGRGQVSSQSWSQLGSAAAESQPLARQQQRNWSIVMLPYPEPTEEAANYFSMYPSARPIVQQPAAMAFGSAEAQTGQQAISVAYSAGSQPWPKAMSSPQSRLAGGEPVRQLTVAQLITEPAERLAQRGVRNAPQQQQQRPPVQADLLTIKLSTQATVGPNQLFWEAAAREAAAQQQKQQQPPARLPISNGHHPPQHREPPPVASVQSAMPLMRRPLVGAVFRQAQDPFAAAGSSHTNGHAYAGSPLKGPQLAAAALDPIRSFGELAQLGHQSPGELHSIAEPAGGFPFGPQAATMVNLDEASLLGQFMAASAAIPASSFVAPPPGAFLDHHYIGLPSPSGDGGGNSSQFLKKGAISAALPVASPSSVSDPWGWPMGYGSQAAKALVYVNQVAPPPSYMIPAHRLAALQQVDPMRLASGVERPTGAWPTHWPHPASADSMLASPSVPASSVARPGEQQVVRPNVIQLTISTRPPTVAPSLGERLRQRLRLFRRHHLAGSNSTARELVADANDDADVYNHRILVRKRRGLVESAVQSLRKQSERMTGKAKKVLRGSDSKKSEARVPAPRGAATRPRATSGRKGARLALLSLPESDSSPSRALIPLLDTTNMIESLEDDLLSQALLYNQQQQQQQQQQVASSSRPQAGRTHWPQDPLAALGGRESRLKPQHLLPLPSMQVASHAALNSPLSTPGQATGAGGQPTASGLSPALEAHLLAQLEQQSLQAASGNFLEPPANEPVVSNQQQQQSASSPGPRERIKQLSKDLIKSSRRPLTRLIKITGNLSGRLQANQTAGAGSVPAAAASSQQPTTTTTSIGQHFNNVVSPSVMMSHHLNSLANFNRFALPLQDWIQQQQALASQWLPMQQAPSHPLPPASSLHNANNNNDRPLLPVASHLNQPFSPYSFILTAGDKAEQQPASLPPLARPPLGPAAGQAHFRQQQLRPLVASANLPSLPLLNHSLANPLALADGERSISMGSFAEPQRQFGQFQFDPRVGNNPGSLIVAGTNQQVGAKHRADNMFAASPMFASTMAPLEMGAQRISEADSHENSGFVMLRRTESDPTHYPRGARSASSIQQQVFGDRPAPVQWQRPPMAKVLVQAPNQMAQFHHQSRQQSFQFPSRQREQQAVQLTTKPNFHFVSPSDLQRPQFETTFEGVQMNFTAPSGPQVSYTDAEIYSSPSDQQPVELSSVDSSSTTTSGDEEASKLLVESATASLSAAPPASPLDEVGSLNSILSSGDQIDLPGSPPPAQQQQQQQVVAPVARPATGEFAMEQQQQFLHSQQQPFLQAASGFVGSSMALPRPRLPKFSMASITNKFRQHLFHTFRLNPLGSRWPNMLASPASLSYHPSDHFGAAPGIAPLATGGGLQQDQVLSGTSYYEYATAQAPKSPAHFQIQFEQQPKFVASPSQPSRGQVRLASQQQQQQVFVTQQPRQILVGKLRSSQPARQQQQGPIRPTEEGSPIELPPEIQTIGAEQSIFNHEATFEQPPTANASLTTGLVELSGPQSAVPEAPGEQQQQQHNPLHNVMTDVSGSLVASDGTYIQKDQALDAKSSQQQQRQAVENAPQFGGQIASALEMDTNSTRAVGLNANEHHQPEPAVVAIAIESDTNEQQQALGEQQLVEQPLPAGGPEPGGILESTPHYELERVRAVGRPKLAQIMYPPASSLRPPVGQSQSQSQSSDLKRPSGGQAKLRAPLEVDYQVIRANGLGQPEGAQVVHLSNGSVVAEGSPVSQRQYRKLKLAPYSKQLMLIVPGEEPAGEQQVLVDQQQQEVQDDSLGANASPGEHQDEQHRQVAADQLYEPDASGTATTSGQTLRVFYGSQRVAVPPEQLQQGQATEQLETAREEPKMVGGPTMSLSELKNRYRPSSAGGHLRNKSSTSQVSSGVQFDLWPMELTPMVASKNSSSPTGGQNFSHPTDQYVLIDQPIVLSGAQQSAEQQVARRPAGSAGQWNYTKAGEQPAVFVSLKPEKVVQQQQQPVASAPQRKRPLKLPKRAPSSRTSSGQQVSPGAGNSTAQLLVVRQFPADQRASESSTSQRTSKPNSNESIQLIADEQASNGLAAIASSSTTSSSNSTSTTRRPEAQTARHRAATLRNNLRNHNLKGAGSSPSGVAAPSSSNTTARDLLARPTPKAKIRWQGATGSGQQNRTTSKSELASSETSRHEQAWIVGGMTHQAYADSGHNSSLAIGDRFRGASSGGHSNHQRADNSTDRLEPPLLPGQDKTSSTSEQLSNHLPSSGGGEQTTSESQAVPPNHRRDSRTGSTSFKLSSSVSSSVNLVHQPLNQLLPASTGASSSGQLATPIVQTNPVASVTEVDATSASRAGDLALKTVPGHSQAAAGGQQEQAELVSASELSPTLVQVANSSIATSGLERRSEPAAELDAGRATDSNSLLQLVRQPDHLPDDSNDESIVSLARARHEASRSASDSSLLPVWLDRKEGRRDSTSLNVANLSHSD